MGKTVNRLLVDKGFAEEVELRTSQRETIRKLKEQLHMKGYHYILSLYGSVQRKNDKEYEYRRIEIMSTTPFNEYTFSKVVEAFKLIIPDYTYTLWLMTPREKMVKAWPKK